ncbi:hypothetical protein SMG44B_40440 [Stenotrophomonas maltophilia]
MRQHGARRHAYGKLYASFRINAVSFRSERVKSPPTEQRQGTR